MVEVTARKIGNSIGFTLPKEYIEISKIKDGDKLHINIVKEADLKHLYGKLKNMKGKLSGQDLKDNARKEW